MLTFVIITVGLFFYGNTLARVVMGKSIIPILDLGIPCVAASYVICKHALHLF